MELSLVVNNVRNIKSANITLPLNKGLYALVGENGAGKSTIMLLLSLMIKTSSAHLLTSKDTKPDSSIVISNSEKMDTWVRNKALKMTTGKYDKTGRLFTSVHYHGFYEGSIFYGTRFDDYDKVDSFFAADDFSAYEGKKVDCTITIKENTANYGGEYATEDYWELNSIDHVY